MEPILSTCFLVAGIALTSQASVNRRLEATPPLSTHTLVVDSVGHPSSLGEALYAYPLTAQLVDVNGLHNSNSRGELFKELLGLISLADDVVAEDAPSIEHLSTAYEFIEALPSYVSSPILMHGDNGQIGMYWDNGDAYLDINIDGFNLLSLYSRVRSSGSEVYIDQFGVEDLTSSWFEENFSNITKQYLVAA